jgi:hypothetical protein
MALLENEVDAQKALAVARQYTRQCFIGRNNLRLKRIDYIFQYWEGHSGLPPAQPQGRCFPYFPYNLRLEEDSWNSHWTIETIVALANRNDAEKALAIVRQHNARCFIGIDNSYPDLQHDYYILEYWQ